MSRLIRTSMIVALFGLLAPGALRADMLVTVAPSSIQRHDANTGAFISTFPMLNETRATTVGPDGSLYTCVTGGVVRYNIETETMIEFWSPPPGPNSCTFSSNLRDIIFTPDGQAFIADCNLNLIRVLDGEIGDCVDSLSEPCPVTFAIGSDGFIYVTSFNAQRIDRIDPINLSSTTVVTGLAQPWGIAARNGELFVANFSSGQILRYDEGTGIFLGLFANVPAQPRGIEFGPGGNLYVATTNGVYRYAPSGASLGLFAAAGQDCLDITFTCEVDLGVDCNGNGMSDACDIESLTSADCNRNGIPDECETGLFEVELSASDGTASDQLGATVDLSGKRLATGAPFANGFGSATGEGYIFERASTGWFEVARLQGSDSTAGDQFGAAAAIDGQTALFGAPATFTGAAYLFELTATGWAEQQKLTAFDGGAGDQFGATLAIDGDRAVIGAPGQSSAAIGAGAAYIFSRGPSGVWTEELKLIPSDLSAGQVFGSSVAISGDIAVVGARGDAGERVLKIQNR